MSKTKNVAVYIRQKIDTPDDFQFTTEITVEHHKKVAENMGHVVGIYIDNRCEKERPSWNNLMLDCCAGKIDLIVIRSISRLGRDTVSILGIIRELESLNIVVF